ncbi:zinc-dependent metalloprotease [Ignavibacteria bacterium]|nr:zinc-dependent metalloprotease [Bacteroidota bacterium]MCZ2132455.1 zinc-dependent metalloprotease [Bacteroidota bacterium]
MQRIIYAAVLLLFSVYFSLDLIAQPPSFTAGDKPKPPAIKPYDEIITKQAVSDSGLFITHRISDKFYFQVPKHELGKEFLWSARVAKTPQLGYGGEEANSLVVKWERKYDRILLRSVSYEVIAADSLPISRAVKASSFDEILYSFPILSFTPDSNEYVIDVTPFFTSDIAAIGPPRGTRDAQKMTTVDKERSYMDFSRSYPDNIETEAVLTYSADRPPQNPESKTVTLTMHHSMARLPENPMQPRLWDKRVGYFNLTQTDYGIPSQRAEQRSYILRWRLEPSDSAAFARGELVEPKKLITYYIDPATPMQWRPWLKKGVEAWNIAFEEAGFKNAIHALDPPDSAEIPDWSPEDMRYSVIRYYPSPIQNAYGPNIHDPRTGEILDADIGWFHNIMNLQTKWYFTQAAADPRTRKLPMPDSLMGELVAFVATHEIGHTLGLAHNMAASSAYPTDSLRSPSFTDTYHVSPSIMDYARFNYVAQPGDGANMMPAVGVYDKYAIRWGYRPIPAAKSPDEEKSALNTWASEASHNRMKRFGFQQWITVDPSSQMEDLGDDAIKSTRYGIANLRRIIEYIEDAVYKEGDDYDFLNEMFGALRNQWTDELRHVAQIPGGVVQNNIAFGQAGEEFSPISKQRQQEAVAFLAENVFATSSVNFLLRPSLLQKLRPDEVVTNIQNDQMRILRDLLASRRLLRMNQIQNVSPAAAYPVVEYLSDIERGLFADLISKTAVQSDAFRRNLQRGYVRNLVEKINPPAAVPTTGFAALFAEPSLAGTDVRGVCIARLENLQTASKTVLVKTKNEATKAHLKDLISIIENALHPPK